MEWIYKKTVNKSWGKEFWLVNSPHYCCKTLYINKGQSFSSVHFHRSKIEEFYLLKGELVLYFRDVCEEFPALNETELMNLDPDAEINQIRDMYYLKKGNIVHIPRFARHQVLALKNCKVLEISTHHDDEDSYRIPNRGISPLKG